MSKEITPLEAYEELYRQCCFNLGRNENLFRIIEKALKELEFYRKRDKQFKQDVNNIADKLKALEIIKQELPVDMLLIRNSVDYEHYIEVSDDNLSREQFYLLKEVLL